MTAVDFALFVPPLMLLGFAVVFSFVTLRLMDRGEEQAKKKHADRMAN